MLRLIRLCFLAAALGVAACSSLPPLETSDAGIPTRAEVAGVPLILQEDYYCGPAALAMVYQWAGQDVTQQEVAELAFSPGAQGTYLADMLGAARRQGQLAVTLSDFRQVMSEVSAGHPVIIFQNLGLSIAPLWHYAVVVGYDLDAGEFYLHSGQHERMVMGTTLLRRTWARGGNWAVVVLPPDQLPASATEQQVLSAAIALERAGNPFSAAEIYENGAAKWPDNWIWLFGLGNSLYANGDLTGARRAYLAASRIAPDIPEIANNLAEVEKELRG